MKKEEIDILGIKKIHEGKSSKQIKEEINNLYNFNREVKSDKKLIVKQHKQIKKLERELNKNKKELFNLKLEQSMKPKDDELTLSDLKKVACLIKEENIGIPKAEIKSLCQIGNKKLDCGLSFLKRNKIINEVIKQGMKYYKK